MVNLILPQVQGISDIQVCDIFGELVVDSRLIAKGLGIQHEALMRTISKYLTELQAFGHLRFENETVTNSVGARNLTKFAFLNEDQATLIMTMSRNTAQVVQLKIDLVSAFKKAKQIVSTVIPAQNERIRELELELRLLEKKESLITLHGKDLALRLMGDKEAVVYQETVITELVEPATGRTTKILTADQLKKAVKERTGQRIPSMKSFTDALRKAGRDDLLVPVTRSQTSEHVPPDRLEEAIAIVFGKQRQRLIGE